MSKPMSPDWIGLSSLLEYGIEVVDQSPTPIKRPPPTVTVTASSSAKVSKRRPILLAGHAATTDQRG